MALITLPLNFPVWLVLAVVQRNVVRSTGDPLADLPSMAHALKNGK